MSKEIEKSLFSDLSKIIEQGKQQAVSQVNSTLTLTYWHVGKKINEHFLNNQRAEYAKEILSTLSGKLVERFGRSFAERNLRRMIQFSEQFTTYEIVSPLATQLSWSHFIELLPLKDSESRIFYAKKTSESNWSKRELRHQIERKAFERAQIANSQISVVEQKNIDTDSVFKDPYLLDFLELKEGYLEKDLETAIVKELELFILELGKGFAFVERQKRMIIDGEDFYLDLLFYNRKLQRLVAVELKLGKFKAAYKGQMELYLKWLDKHERHEGENSPIGLILCAGKSAEQIELLEMHKDGIMVAEYWTELLSKKKLEQKLHSLLVEAKARIENHNMLEE